MFFNKVFSFLYLENDKESVCKFPQPLNALMVVEDSGRRPVMSCDMTYCCLGMSASW